MRKIIAFIVILFSFSPVSYGDENKGLIEDLYRNSPLCIARNVKAIVKRIDRYQKIDKFKHCAVTCQLSLKCSGIAALSAGALKEIIDAIGPGDSDIKDMQANYIGKYFVDVKLATTNQECINRCDEVDWRRVLNL